MRVQAKRLLAEIWRAIEIVARAHDRVDALNEADTKATLFDPVLGVLGLKVRDPFTVSHLYRRRPQANPIDYIVQVTRSPIPFVKASKALN